MPTSDTPRLDAATAAIAQTEEVINRRTNNGVAIDGAAVVAMALVAIAKALLVTDFVKEA